MSFYVFPTGLITMLVLDYYSIFVLISRSPSLIASFLFYTLFCFHLHPSRAKQMVGFDTYPITTFLKSLGSSYKDESHYLGITFILMRPEN